MAHVEYYNLEEVWFYSESGMILSRNQRNELTCLKQCEPFGIIMEKKNKKITIGCGYHFGLDEIFFTANGKKLFSVSCQWNYISAFLSVKYFTEINVNYGKDAFLFDLLTY